MKIVIDISKERYDEIMSMDWKNCRLLFDEEIRAIHDGKALEQKPSSSEEPNKWIPVSERLPEDIMPVMVTWKNNDPESYYQYIVGKHFIGVAHYLKGKWYWYSSTTEDFLAEYGRYDGEEFDEAIEVVAWCPLPKPYKAEGSDKE